MPIALKKIVETVHAEHPRLIKIVDPGPGVLKLVETDETSDFFFAILKSHAPSDPKNPVTYTGSIRPHSQYEVETHNVELIAEQVEKSLRRWVAILKEYEKESALFDDPILRRYYEDLGIYFNITDPDAATAPYRLAEQQFLYQFFEHIKILALGSKNAQAKENEVYVSEIIQAFTGCQDNLGRETKLEVVDRFKRGLAKIIKYNLPLAQAIIDQINKPEIQKIITGGTKVVLHSRENP